MAGTLKWENSYINSPPIFKTVRNLATLSNVRMLDSPSSKTDDGRPTY